jgi:hypothetical protein
VLALLALLAMLATRQQRRKTMSAVNKLDILREVFPEEDELDQILSKLKDAAAFLNHIRALVTLNRQVVGWHIVREETQGNEGL